MKRILLTLVAAVAVTGLVISDASADGFGGRGRGGRGFGGIGGIGNNIRIGNSNIFDLYLSGQSPIPPYFALNPPVYYSYPVPRTYGHSPFAYSGNVRTPDVLANSQPMEVINPYVPSSSKKPSSTKPSPQTTVNKQAEAPTPLMVENPYFSEQEGIYTVSH